MSTAKQIFNEAFPKLRAPVADEREAFEAWARNGFELHRHGGAEYSSHITQCAWAAWQARAALAAPAAPQPSMIQVARQNLRAFLTKASFAVEVDRQAAVTCLDVLEEALAAPAAQAAPHAGEDAREAKQRILDAAQWWADQRELGPRPAKEAWAALAMRIDAELAMLADGYTPQPAAQAAPAVPPEMRRHIKNLIDVVRMPNAEFVADDHNAAVRYLRSLTTQGESHE